MILTMEYHTSSRDYLKRAKAKLKEGTPESLFYAAFELRCGIEQRMREYLEAWDHVSEKKKQGWRFPELGRTIDHTFKLGDKVARFTITSDKKDKIYGVFYYTPVSSELKEMAGRIGNYLHAFREYKPPTDEWWNETRTYLENVYVELRKACSGTLLGAPLVSPDGKMSMPMQFDEKAAEIKELGMGGQAIMTVEYLDEYPSELDLAT